ncbi:MAG: hypothetical protein AUG51_14290 [Acidobacteria bacterium 13_1_20CM_3_53_8]|nr:MAG: hypothetical protein AUG51_14290 [Acidobacteria bacterium 13_1_20CM_3_53_8]
MGEYLVISFFLMFINQSRHQVVGGTLRLCFADFSSGLAATEKRRDQEWIFLFTNKKQQSICVESYLFRDESY